MLLARTSAAAARTAPRSPATDGERSCASKARTSSRADAAASRTFATCERNTRWESRRARVLKSAIFTSDSLYVLRTDYSVYMGV